MTVPDEALHRFRLYVAGEAQNSLAAIANLQAICDRHLPAQHRIEVIDLVREPMRGIDDGVLLTPMLVRLAPGSVRRVVGSLSDTDAVLRTLGLSVSASLP
jgi:circadian clock protein KaiB